MQLVGQDFFSIGQGGHPLKIRDPFKLGFDKISCRDGFFVPFQQ